MKFSRASVRTVYFDDVNLRSYYESRDGHLDKHKYRWREYVGPEEGGARYSIEIKIRSASTTRKIKEYIHARLPENYRPASFRSLISRLGVRHGFLPDDIPDNLHPTVTICYDRYRFHDLRDEDVRYNLDSNIRTYLVTPADTASNAFIRCDTDILEVKAPADKQVNSGFIGLLGLDAKPISFSKYMWGMEAWASMSAPFDFF